MGIDPRGPVRRILGWKYVFLKPIVASVLALTLFGTALVAYAATERPVKIVAFGDSLTVGYGLPATDTFPVKLAHALEAKGIKVQIVNGGVSGDTASGGLARLDWSLPSDTDAVILELGANDAMRGIDPAVTRQALAAILTKLKERGVAVLLCGMYAPPNMGADFERGHGRNQMKRLKHNTNVTAAKPCERILVEAADVFPRDHDRAGIGAFEPGHDHQ